MITYNSIISMFFFCETDVPEMVFWEAIITQDDFRVICLDVLKRMLEPIREAAYGSHLRLPFETLADEAMIVAEKSKKTKRLEYWKHMETWNL